MKMNHAQTSHLEDASIDATIPGLVRSRLDEPQNGLGGLKHWPYDTRSGFMVAMVSLPFSPNAW
ncbi:MAG: hypothetical protein AB8B50_05310 [Pirellulaceae bacterium]